MSNSSNLAVVVVNTQDDSSCSKKTATSTAPPNNTSFSSLMSHYLIRDLILWIVFIFFLPILLFGVYYLTKEPLMIRTTTQINHTNSTNSTNSLTATDKNLPRRPMRKIQLSKYPDSLCMDGSTASYYLRQSRTRSKTWIIFLEGGFFCHDTSSCRQRSSTSFELTSSLNNKLFKDGKGVLSYSSVDNEQLFDVNAVNIPYCSSDLWIGSKKCNMSTRLCADGFHFLGQRILDSVLDDLIHTHSMDQAELIVMMGGSAGGLGLLLNSNRIKIKLEAEAPRARLKSVVDSAWLLDMPLSLSQPQTGINQQVGGNGLVEAFFDKTIRYWNAQLPIECKEEMLNPWDCFLPHKLTPFIQVPTLIVQSQFDQIQLMDQYGMSSYQSITDFLGFFKNLSSKMKNSIEKLHFYFMPACVSHMMLLRNDWRSFKIGTLSLQEVVSCWVNEDCDKSNLRKIDDCTWPNCHEDSCPSLEHPDTPNKHVNPIEYFSYFGLINYGDMSAKANVSESVLRKMDYYGLIKLLSLT